MAVPTPSESHSNLNPPLAGLSEIQNLNGSKLPAIPSPNVDAFVTTKAKTESNSFLSNSEIKSKLITRGFPELNRHWGKFERLNKEARDINPEKLEKLRDAHTNSLFGYPLLISTSIGLPSAYFAWWTMPIIKPVAMLGETLTHGLWVALTTSNLIFAGIIGANQIQRRLADSIETRMAEETGFMCSLKNFRSWFSKSERALTLQKTLSELGINEDWDNPKYLRNYESIDGKWQSKIPKLSTERLHETMREFLGYLDPVKRIFIQGKYIHDLVNQKNSVTDFVKSYRKQIELSKLGELPLAEGVKLLKILVENFVKPNTQGALFLREEIRALDTTLILPKSGIQAKIWDRDPWVDLTSQDEFFSSASLRGVNKVGSGVKGRLGTFNYMYNPSISALDFSTRTKRAVRARIAITKALDPIQGEIPLLYVDGVEGSNSIDPSLIKKAIEEYAESIGCFAVGYGTYSHNKVPQRFAAFVKGTGAPRRCISLQYLDNKKKEYLDSFAAPLEPFEYAHPTGKVLAYVISVKKDYTPGFSSPTFLEYARAFIRKNLFNAVICNALVFGAFASASIYPMVLIPYTAIVGLGVGYHMWFQRRSLKKER